MKGLTVIQAYGSALASLAMCASTAGAQVISFNQAKERADTGDAFAHAIVAMHYQLGWNTEKNLERAAKYATASAKARSPLGYFRVGTMMRNGEGFAKDEKKGLELQAASYNALKEAKDPYSITATAIMIFQGKVVGQNLSEDERRRIAVSLYKQAADMGFAPAQFNYAMALQDGHGVEKYPELSEQYLAKARDASYPLAKKLPVDPNRMPSMATVHQADASASLWRRGLERFELGARRLAGLQEYIGWNREIQLGKETFSQVRYLTLSDEINEVRQTVNAVNQSAILLPEPLDPFDGKDISAIWMREKDPQWSIKFGAVEPVFQRSSGRPVYSEAIGQRFMARTYIGDLRVYVYDKKSMMQIVSINKDELFPYTGRDTGVLPRNLCFSEDEKYLLFRTETDAWLNGSGVVYVFNLQSFEISFCIGKFPLFVQNSEGMITLPQELEIAGAYRASDGTGNDEFSSFKLAAGEKLFVADSGGTTPSMRRLIGRFEAECRSLPLEVIRIESPQQEPSDGNCKVWTVPMAPENFIFDWVEVFGEYLWNLDIAKFEFKKYRTGDADHRPSTASSGPVLNCFWGYLTENDHECAEPLCGKMLNKGLITKSPSGRWLAVRSFTAPGSGWYGLQSLGLYDSERRGWIALPDRKGIWGRNERAANGQFSLFLHDLVSLPPGAPFPLVLPQGISVNDSQNRVCFSENPEVVWISSEQGGLYEIDPLSPAIRRRVDGVTPFGSLAVSEDWIVGIPQRLEPKAELWRKGEFEKVADIFFAADGGALILLSDLYYTTLNSLSDAVAFRVGQRGYPFEQFDLRLNRPDIVLERLGAPAEAIAIARQLREKRLKRMGVNEEMLKPDFHVPELEIIGDMPTTTEAGDINLEIKASDNKYPLERLKIYVNNVPVNGRDGESLRNQNTQNLKRTIPIKLAVGRNKIQVSVLNAAGAESLYANAEVNCTASRPKPTLYAVALGVSEYSNPDWNLKYAAKDAADVMSRLKVKAGESYGEVRQLLLTDKQVTKESLGKVREFLQPATIDDTVLLFVAGHGLLDKQYDYYFGTTDIDVNDPSDRGIAFEELDDLLAGLPCLKKALLIDTCHAGEIDEEEKTLLASTGGASAPLATGKGIAMRAIGTRGMSIKKIEGARGAGEWHDRLQGLFVDLRRGSGATVLSSSAGAEYALESSEQQNGLFTYAVLEALDGAKEADANKDGSLQMSELGEYVKKRVAELTNHKQTPNTRRVNLEGDFVLSKLR
jgi:TPR repeat protein